MPLEKSSSKAAVSRNIHELTHHGRKKRSHKQIVAIALHTQDEAKKRAMKKALS